MFGWLRDRGHVIEQIRWPDREREGRKGQVTSAKTVDLTFQEDGREVGVDIIELHESARHARQYAEMGRIVGQMEQELTTRIRELSPGNTIAISWDIGWLPSGKIMRAGLEVVKATILTSAAGLRDGDNIELDPKPDFIPHLEAHCYASSTPKFGFISMPAEQTLLVVRAAESMAEQLLASSKPEQLRHSLMPGFWRLTEPSCRSLPSCGLRSKFDAPGFLRTGQPSTSYFSGPTAHSARSGAEALANCYCLTPGPPRPLTPAEACSDGQGSMGKP
jgi:hypothetical protein